MSIVNHINYPDDAGRIFCKEQGKIIKVDDSTWDICSNCPYFSGDYQGNGIECAYEDNAEFPTVYVDNPQAEYERVLGHSTESDS